MTTTHPDEIRYYLDETQRMLEGLPRRSGNWRQRRGVRIAYGTLGLVLFALSVYEFLTDGLSTELFVYANFFLGLAFLATALNVDAGRLLFGHSPSRPFLALRSDGLIMQTSRREHTLLWAEIEALETSPTKLTIVSVEGEALPISFSNLSYERVQELKSVVLEAAQEAGVLVR